MSWSGPWFWAWPALVVFECASAIVFATRPAIRWPGRPQPHQHQFRPAAVSYPVSSVSQVFAGVPAKPVTYVLFRCTGCTEPGSLMSVELHGRWDLKMISGDAKLVAAREEASDATQEQEAVSTQG